MKTAAYLLFPVFALCFTVTNVTSVMGAAGAITCKTPLDTITPMSETQKKHRNTQSGPWSLNATNHEREAKRRMVEKPILSEPSHTSGEHETDSGDRRKGITLLVYGLILLPIAPLVASMFLFALSGVFGSGILIAVFILNVPFYLIIKGIKILRKARKAKRKELPEG